MSTDSMGQWDVDEELVAEIEREGNRQIEIGYTERADDGHHIAGWDERISRYSAKAAIASRAGDMVLARRRLVQVCALSIKALQAFDRQHKMPERQTEQRCDNCRFYADNQERPIVNAHQCHVTSSAPPPHRHCEHWLLKI